ncbi:MAG: mechanosensitive ion channel family protein, partial [Alphaproteobacteria bacterium]|nr:mechanosensitive ion channel family protein [Alphaproteobacteria bacterium]
AIKKDDRVMTDEGKTPQIMVTNLGAFSVDITLRMWSATSDSWLLKIDTIKIVKEAFDKEGISIPFPTRTIEIINSAPDETLKKSEKA